jgi:hypothetical protein
VADAWPMLSCGCGPDVPDATHHGPCEVGRGLEPPAWRGCCYTHEGTGHLLGCLWHGQFPFEKLGPPR